MEPIIYTQVALIGTLVVVSTLVCHLLSSSAARVVRGTILVSPIP